MWILFWFSAVPELDVLEKYLHGTTAEDLELPTIQVNTGSPQHFANLFQITRCPSEALAFLHAGPSRLALCCEAYVPRYVQRVSGRRPTAVC